MPCFPLAVHALNKKFSAELRREKAEAKGSEMMKAPLPASDVTDLHVSRMTPL